MEPSPQRRIIAELNEPDEAGYDPRRLALEHLQSVETQVLALTTLAGSEIAGYVSDAAQAGQFTLTSLIMVSDRPQRRLELLAMQTALLIEESLRSAVEYGIQSQRQAAEQARLEAGLVILVLRTLADDLQLGNVVVERAAQLGLKGEPVRATLRRAASIIGDNLRARLTVASSINEPIETVVRDVTPQVTGQNLTSAILAQRAERSGYGSFGARAVAATALNYLTAYGQGQLAWGEAYTQYLVGYLWKLGFNENHCKVCLDLAGRVYPVNAPELKKFQPHINCRCTLEPVWNTA